MAPSGRRRVNPRARKHQDRAGDPLDGLVNLFDLGIVLSVAFLLAALSSLDLEAALFNTEQGRVPEDTVVAEEGETVRSVDLAPGARVVGRGEQVGTVYRLTDGRTVIVQGDDGATGEPSTEDSPPADDSSPTDGSGTGDSGTGGSPPTGGTDESDEPSLNDVAPPDVTDESP